MNGSSTALVVWCVDINAAPVPPSMGPRDLLAAVGFFGRVPALDARDEKPRRFSWEAPFAQLPNWEACETSFLSWP